MPMPTEVKTQSDIQNLPIRRYDDIAAVTGISRISWGSVFAGSAVGLVLQVWLTMLGVAVGASTVDPLQEANPLSGLGVGSLVWLGVSILISSYVGGRIAGRFSGAARRPETTVHGAASWAVTNIVAFLLAGSVFGAIFMGAAHATGSVLSAAGQAAGTAGAQNPGLINQAADAARRDATALMNQGGQPNGATGNVQAQARQAGDVAACATSRTSWGIVILMLLGLVAGLGGAASATPMNSPAGRQK